jgi:hypothetical protein
MFLNAMSERRDIQHANLTSAVEVAEPPKIQTKVCLVKPTEQACTGVIREECGRANAARQE